MRKPLPTPRPYLCVHPIGTLLPNPQTGFCRVHSKTFQPIELVKYEHGRFPPVNIVIGPYTARRHRMPHARSDAGRVRGEIFLLEMRWRDDEGGPGEAHFFTPIAAGGFRLAGV